MCAFLTLSILFNVQVSSFLSFSYCSLTTLTELIKNKGLEKITVEEMVAEVTPQGKATVPDKVRAELLQKIKEFIATQS